MKVTVVCFGMMRDYLPPGTTGNRAVFDVGSGTTVADVAARLGAPEEAVFAILVDGVQAPSTETVTEGSEVTLMPPFTGGSN